MIRLDAHAAVPAPAVRWRGRLSRSSPAGRRLRLAALLWLAGCGGGGGEAPLVLTLPAAFSTPATGVTLSGAAPLPAGSERVGGSIFQPLVQCSLGPYTMNWSNDATGETGPATLFWDCTKDEPGETPQWATPRIALAIGANRITLTLRDATREAQSSMTVTRTP